MARGSHIPTMVSRTLLVLWFSLLWPAVAWADPVNVPLTGGTTVFNGGTLEFQATGPNLVMGGIDPFASKPCSPCPVGSVVRAGLHTDFAFAGGVIYNGITLPVNDAPVPGTVTLSWNVIAASIVMPAAVGDPFTISEPFSVTAHVGFLFCPNCIPGVSSIDGSGVGTLTLSFAPLGANSWTLTGAAWRIETPEPGTWLLLATGVGWLGLRRWRSAKMYGGAKLLMTT